MAPKRYNMRDSSSEEEEQQPAEEEEEEEDDEKEYVVERIDGWRYNLAAGQKEFYVKWEGYPVDENTWEPEDHLTNVKLLLGQFISNLSAEQLRFFNSRKPRKLNGFQRNAPFRRCVGSMAPHESDSEDSPKPNKQRFYVLVDFEDSDQVEEVTLKDLARYNPKAFVEFCERRLLSSNFDR